LRRAFRDMGREFNAQGVYHVNAYSANWRDYCPRMPKKPEADPSPFWKRMTEAWGERRLPTTQNGVATLLDMSQGSTRRWFTGAGLPETRTIIDIADRGRVTVDWLLTGRMPKRPIPIGGELERVLMAWNELDRSGRDYVLRSIDGQRAMIARGARPQSGAEEKIQTKSA